MDRAVVVPIFNDFSETLMFRRQGTLRETGWEPINGRFEEEETSLDAAKRETRLWSGLSPIPGRFEVIGIVPGHFFVGALEATVIASRYVLGNIRMSKPGYSEYRWMDIDEAIKSNYLQRPGPEMIGPSYEFFQARLG